MEGYATLRTQALAEAQEAPTSYSLLLYGLFTSLVTAGVGGPHTLFPCLFAVLSGGVVLTR